MPEHSNRRLVINSEPDYTGAVPLHKVTAKISRLYLAHRTEP